MRIQSNQALRMTNLTKLVLIHSKISAPKVSDAQFKKL